MSDRIHPKCGTPLNPLFMDNALAGWYCFQCSGGPVNCRLCANFDIMDLYCWLDTDKMRKISTPDTYACEDFERRQEVSP